MGAIGPVLRLSGRCASAVLRHAVATGILVVAAVVVWTVAYVGLMLWAMVVDGDLGGPLAYPAGLVVLMSLSLATSVCCFLPATLTAELYCRWRSLSTLWGIPLSFGLMWMVTCLWTWITYDWATGGLQQGLRYASILSLVLAGPLGFYWWIAQWPHVLSDMIKRIRHSGAP